MASNEEVLRGRVYKFYADNIQSGKMHTVRHFMAEGVPRTTIYDILQRFDNRLPATRQPGSGGSNVKLTPRNLATLKRLFDHKDGISQRQAAQRFKCTQQTISNSLKRLNIKARKKKRIPHRDERQISEAKRLCGRLYRKFSNCSWVIDDESYFTLSHSTISGNNIFYTSNVDNTPPSVKFSTKKKFEKKAIVWMIIGPNGWSEPLIKESNFATNGSVYLEECIKK